ncbi:MAG: cytochrome o ubiquinol oxidase subunit IV [Pseudomonadota bacterium]
MSDHSADMHEAVDGGHGGGHGDGHHGSTYRGYITGFVLSALLTIVPFAIVIGEVDVSLGWALAVIFGLGAVQIMVHVYYFLHVTFAAENGWQVLSITFTAIVLVICLVGSIWVMFHLEENMMPAHEQIEAIRNLP